MEDSEQGGEISYMQMREAYSYLVSYLKFAGLDPALDYPETEKEVPKSWPESAKKAWEVVDEFHKKNKDVLF